MIYVYLNQRTTHKERCYKPQRNNIKININQVNRNQDINSILAKPNMQHIQQLPKKEKSSAVKKYFSNNYSTRQVSAFIFLPTVYVLTMQRSVEKDRTQISQFALIVQKMV